VIIIKNNCEKSSVNPLISVIIPVFNAEAYIRKCLDSVTKSTLKDIEIICVDDGSTDGSLTILEEYGRKDERVKVLVQGHQYAGAARNYGLAVAQGEYVHFIDADDWIDAEAYEKWYLLAKENRADVCSCMHYNVDVQMDKILPAEDEIYKKRQDRYLQITNFEDDAEYLIFGVVVPWNKIYLRNFLKNNNIRFDNLVCAEDRGFYFNVIYKAKRLAIVREYWLYHRINIKSSLDGSDIRLINYDVEFQSFEYIWKVIKDAPVKAKRMVLDACIGDSLHYYLKSVGTVYEETLKEKIYRYWSLYIPFLGDELFKAGWLPHYLKLIKNNQKAIDKIEIQPVDLSCKTKTFVFSFDEKYVKYFSVALLSLIMHASPENQYEIIVLYDRVSNEKQAILQSLLPENFTIRFICVTSYVNEILGDLKAKVSSRQWDVSTFYDMLVPLLMHSYERVLYCDSDIVFNRNPDIIFEIPFDNKQLVAIKDTLQTALEKFPENGFLQKQKTFLNHDLGIDNLREYFNGGVLLFNIKAILKEEYLERALKALSFPVLPTVDQDALNFVFKGNVKIISQRFNYQYHLLNEFSETELKNEVASEYLAEGKDPVIVHYTTHVKPWNNPCCALGHLFWKYARISPFYEEIIYENVLKNRELLVEQRDFTHLLSETDFKSEFCVPETEWKEEMQEVANLKQELKDIKSGWSFRIGRILTFLPRIIRDWMKSICLKKKKS
jgi:lipopolysaccharide biosynthesis glycosyltransferase/glycosyltransferase involved in cell wall biosynthesis